MKGPETGGELRATVGGDERRNTEVGNPGSKEGSGAGFGSDVIKGNRLHPAGRAVNDREERQLWM